MSRPRALVTDEGLLLPVRPPSALLLVGLALGALLLLAATVGLIVFTVQGAWRSLLGIPVTAAGVLLFGAAARSMLREDRSGATGLLLTPAGIRLTDRDVPVAVPWEGITSIEETSPLIDSAKDRHPRWITFVLAARPDTGLEDELRLLSGSPYPSIDAAGLVAGRRLTLEVSRYYRLHADERAQLSTPAALERVESLG